jgi:hypothetical protein
VTQPYVAKRRSLRRDRKDDTVARQQLVARTVLDGQVVEFVPVTRTVADKTAAPSLTPLRIHRGQLTQQKFDKLISLLRVGVYLHIACRSVGISDTTFYNWSAAGKAIYETDETSTDWRVTFYLATMQAQAEARAGAEALVYAENPLAWLKAGPGRDKPGDPGWADRSEQHTTVAGDPSAPITITTTWAAQILPAQRQVQNSVTIDEDAD